MGFAMANQLMQGMGRSGAAAPAAAGAMPPPLEAVWYMAVNGQRQGPFAATQVTEGVASGQVTAETLVWRAGMSGWVAAGQVPELADYFQAPGPTPPPLP